MQHQLCAQSGAPAGACDASMQNILLPNLLDAGLKIATWQCLCTSASMKPRRAVILSPSESKSTITASQAQAGAAHCPSLLSRAGRSHASSAAHGASPGPAPPRQASAGCNAFRRALLTRRHCSSRALRHRGAPRSAPRRPQVLSGPAHAAALPEQGPCAAAAHLALLVVAHVLLHLGRAGAVVDLQARQLVRERDADDLADHRDLDAGGPGVWPRAGRRTRCRGTQARQ